MDPGILFFKDTIHSTSSDSSDTEEEVSYAVAAATFASSLCAKPEKRQIVRQDNFMETIGNYSDEEFQENFRVSREAFKWLHGKLENKLKTSMYGPERLPAEKQLLATIWILSTPDSYRSIGGRFDMPKSTLFKCFERVVKAINTLATEIIKWPSGEERQRIQADFFKWGKLPGVVGAIDGTYIPIKAPQNDPQAYVNRKCFHAITLQAICDNKRCFTDIFVGFPSSVGDFRIFKNSDIYKTIMQNPENFFQENEYIIGDKAYPILKWIIPRYIERGNFGRKEVNFNTQHAKTRQVIERCFALLFGRFRRLKYLDMSKTKFIPEVVMAACILHNICLKFNDYMLDAYTGEGLNNAINNYEQADGDINVQADVLRGIGIRRRDEIANSLLN